MELDLIMTRLNLEKEWASLSHNPPEVMLTLLDMRGGSRSPPLKSVQTA